MTAAATLVPPAPVRAAAPAADGPVQPPFDRRVLRRVLGLFPTGVTVVTTWDAHGRPVGATVSSFNSGSLEPPRVLFSLGRDSACCRAFEEGDALTIHVLGDDQAALSNRFAGGGADKWAGLVHGIGATGAPLIDGALATFECRMYARYPGGDHVIFVAEIRQLRFRSGEPLVFGGGGYRRLAPAEASR